MARHGIPTADFVVCDDGRRGARGGRRGSLRFPGRRQGRRSGRRQGRGHRRGPRARPRPPCAPRWSTGSSATPARRLVIEECLTGPEVSFFVLGDGRARSLSAPRRITSASSTTTAGRTPAGWARSRRARCSRPNRRATCGSEIVAPVLAGLARRGRSVPRVPLRQPDAHADGPRSSSSTCASAIPRRRSCCRCSKARSRARCWRRPPAALATPRSDSAADRAVGVVLASRGYPASSESGRAIHGLDAPRRCRTSSCFTPARSRRESISSRPAAAC